MHSPRIVSIVKMLSSKEISTSRMGKEAVIDTTMNEALIRLIRSLSASFSNQEQAFENPPLYGNILVRLRPLPQLDPGSLLLEQAYAIASNEPYRVRVLQPTICPTRGLLILNYAIRDDQRFWGSVEDPQRRSLLTAADLTLLEGCSYQVQETDEGFRGEVEPGCRCLVTRRGKTSYLVSSFELTDDGMSTIDRGYDPATHEHLWGSIAGPFQFKRTDDHSAEIPDHWITDLKNNGGTVTGNGEDR